MPPWPECNQRAPGNVGLVITLESTFGFMINLKIFFDSKNQAVKVFH